MTMVSLEDFEQNTASMFQSVAAGAAASRFRFEALGAIEADAGSPWLVSGALPARGLAVIYGPPGSGKSFITLDLTLRLAAGAALYAGRKAKHRGTVYVAAEAGAGFRRRVVAARRHLDMRGDEPFAMIAAAPNLATAEGDVALLIEAIRSQSAAMGWSPGVIVLDTLARVIPGADENSSRDIGVFISNADRLAASFDCLVVAVHHSGKIAEAGMRGSSALHGAADAEWAVGAEGGRRMVRVAKSKEGETGAAWGFDLRPVDLGRDDEGDPITTCVVEIDEDIKVTPQTPKAAPVPASLRLLIDAIRSALLDHGREVRPWHDGPTIKAVKLDLAREEYVRRHGADTPDSRTRAFRRALSAAIDRQVVTTAEVDGVTQVWLP